MINYVYELSWIIQTIKINRSQMVETDVEEFSLPFKWWKVFSDNEIM